MTAEEAGYLLSFFILEIRNEKDTRYKRATLKQLIPTSATERMIMKNRDKRPGKRRSQRV